MSEQYAPSASAPLPLRREYEPRDTWPKPDARLLNGGVRPAPKFPLETLGAVAPFVADLAASKGAPIDYAAAPLLAFAAGMVGASRSVQVRPGWVEPCILWVASVGAPSSGKSPPLLAWKRAAAAIEREAAGDLSARKREFETKRAEAQAVRERWEADVKSAVKAGSKPPQMPPAADEPDEPLPPRIMVADVTTEKLARLIAENPRGVISVRDELAGLIGNFGKYGGEDAPFYLSAYSGDFSPVDRVKGGTITAPRAALSMVGAIQPDKVQELMASRSNDGLVARFLPVWPDPAQRVWDVPEVDERQAKRMFERLYSLAMDTSQAGELQPRVVPLSKQASRIYSAWWCEQEAKAAHASGFMAEFIGKADGTCARVALVLELLDWAVSGDGPTDSPREVSADAVERACVLFADYFEPMAERVYADASQPFEDRRAVALLKAIRRHGVRRFNARQVYRGEGNWRVPGFSKPADVEAACAILIDGDCLKEAPKEPGRGAPRKDYLVNPHLLEGRATDRPAGG